MTAALGETPPLQEVRARDSVAPLPEGGPVQAPGPTDQDRAEAAHLESGPSPAAAEAVAVAAPDGAPVRRTHRGRRGGGGAPGAR